MAAIIVGAAFIAAIVVIAKLFAETINNLPFDE